jgi:hypothetical protein
MRPAPGRQSRGDGRESAAHRRARALLARAVARLPEEQHDWGEAMLAELDQITGRVGALGWALGGFRLTWLARRQRRGRKGDAVMAISRRRTGWSAAALWALWAAITTLLVFEFPTAAIVFGLAGFGLARFLRVWPEGVGALGGAGAICVLIGLLNLGGGQPCSSSRASSCGGVAPLPLLIAGCLLIAASVALYSVTARQAAR